MSSNKLVISAPVSNAFAILDPNYNKVVVVLQQQESKVMQKPTQKSSKRRFKKGQPLELSNFTHSYEHATLKTGREQEHIKYLQGQLDLLQSRSSLEDDELTRLNGLKKALARAQAKLENLKKIRTGDTYLAQLQAKQTRK